MVVKGSIEVYERDGRYQLYASEITLDGTGDLFRRFEKLRNELEEMGMFSPEYKTPISKYAKTVGIVTASTGAAIRDIINISGRRNPYVQLVSARHWCREQGQRRVSCGRSRPWMRCIWMC